MNSLLKILFFVLTILLVKCADYDELKKEGENIALKIELYKCKHGSLPDSLEDIGIEFKMEGPFFYDKVDSLRYSLYFGTVLGESMFYHPDKDKWSHQPFP